MRYIFKRGLTLTEWHRLFRTKDWWNYTIPPILGFYFIGRLAASEYSIPVEEMLLVISLMVLLAAFGFFIGEWSDIGDDRSAGKENVLAGTSFVFRIIVVLFIVLLLCGVSWRLQLDKLQTALVAAQVLCFILYSIPPLRFKRNKFTGVILESLYSGTLMYVFVFSLSVEQLGITALFLALWGSMKGLRNYLLHTVRDAPNDRKANISTVGNTFPERTVLLIVRWGLVPLELFFLIVFFGLLTPPLHVIFITALLLSVVYIVTHTSKTGEMIRFRFLVNLNLFHELVLMMLSLSVLSVYDLRWILVIVIMLLIFTTYLRWIQGIFNYLRSFIATGL